MHFPDRDAMTAEETAANNAAQCVLVRGKYYRFDPPISATGIPTGGSRVCKLQVLEFDRGVYLGMRDGNHIFQGKPINDPRPIRNEALRECYFHVLFTGGCNATLDTDQSHS